MRQVVILIPLSLLLADSAAAGSFWVKLLSESGEIDRPVEVVATSTDALKANTISAVTAVPGEAQFLIEEEGTTWRISVVDEDYWSASSVVFVSEKDESLLLKVYPVGMLTGKLALSTSKERFSFTICGVGSALSAGQPRIPTHSFLADQGFGGLL